MECKSIQGVERAKTHLNHSHNPLVNQWIRELKSEDYEPLIHVLEDVEDWTQLADKEKYWVGKLLGEGADLFNVLIRESYNDSAKAYNDRISLQLSQRKQLLEDKLTKSISHFGGCKDLAQLIKRRRKILKITQRQLAEISGIGVRTLKSIEDGDANPTINTLTNILDTLGYEQLIVLKMQ